MKNFVEKAPEIDLQEFDIKEIFDAVRKVDIVDHKGRYLHWNDMKWRLKGTSREKLLHWHAVRTKRGFAMHNLPFESVSGDKFGFLLTDQMTSNLHWIDKSTGNYGSGTTPQSWTSDEIHKKYLVSSLMIEEAITSAQLEGAATTRAVAKKMLLDKIPPSGEDEQMILNNYMLLQKAKSHVDDEISIPLILDFHRVATEYTTENDVMPGEFRKSNDIYISGKDDESIYMPPSHDLIESRLQTVCDFINEDHSGRDGKQFIHPIVKAIVLHFMIGYEHPFRDGNGRTARALFYWFVLKNGYNIFEYISISRLLREKPQDYSKAYLFTEKDKNDLTYFIDFNIIIIKRSIEDLYRYLEREKDEFLALLQLIENKEELKKLSFHQKEILKRGLKHPGKVFTAKGVESEFAISNNSARQALNGLVNRKLLLASQEGKLTLYLSPNDLKYRILSKH